MLVSGRRMITSCFCQMVSEIKTNRGLTNKLTDLCHCSVLTIYVVLSHYCIVVAVPAINKTTASQCVPVLVFKCR